MRLSLGITPKSYFNLAVPNDTDAQAFITAAGITDATQQSAVNQLVLDLKSANIWTKMKAIYPIVGGSASTHKWNLKDPRDLDAAYRLTFSTGWTHSSTGMTPNGTSAYASTFLVPSSVFNTTTYNHLSYYSRTNNTNIDFLMGARNSNETAMILSGRDGFWGYYCDAPSPSVYRNAYSTSSFNTAAFSLGSQTGTNVKVYRNNSIVVSNTEARFTLSALCTRALIIGAWDSIGTIGNYTNKQCAFSSIGDGLTDTEASNLYTAVQNYNTTLGRQV
jgi:hypothetical protein